MLDAVERARTLVDRLADKQEVSLPVWQVLDALVGAFEAMIWDAARPVVINLGSGQGTKVSDPLAAKEPSVPKGGYSDKGAYL
jgi:hypothetical protein